MLTSGLPSSFGTQFRISWFQSVNFSPDVYGTLSRTAIASLMWSGSAAMWSILTPLTPGAVFFLHLAINLSNSCSVIPAVKILPYILPFIFVPVSLDLHASAHLSTPLTLSGIFFHSDSGKVPSCIFFLISFPSAVLAYAGNSLPLFLYHLCLPFPMCCCDISISFSYIFCLVSRILISPVSVTRCSVVGFASCAGRLSA